MAGTITHSWKGTVLTIQSDSGVSSADLGGATGCRGPQGRPGVVYDETGKILIADLASLEYVDAELAKYDDKTLIRDENGNLMTAVGGYIIDKVESELVDSMDNVPFVAMSVTATYKTVVFELSDIDTSLLTDGVGYDIYMTLNNGAEVEFKNVTYSTASSNPPTTYFTGNEYAESAHFWHKKLHLYMTDHTIWKADALAVTHFEIKTHGYCIYSPIDGRALSLDENNITLNKQNQLTVGSNVVVESRMAKYVEEQIDLAKIGGDDPAEVLANYYTKAQVDAKFAAILNSEEVPY